MKNFCGRTKFERRGVCVSRRSRAQDPYSCTVTDPSTDRTIHQNIFRLLFLWFCDKRSRRRHNTHEHSNICVDHDHCTHRCRANNDYRAPLFSWFVYANVLIFSVVCRLFGGPIEAFSIDWVFFFFLFIYADDARRPISHRNTRL